MILKVNATRMELSRLNKELKIAISGHKLLKDKRDEMMRRLIEMKKDATSLRLQLAKVTNQASKLFAFASASVGEKEFRNYFFTTNTETQIDKNSRNVMSIPIPHYKINSVQEYPTSHYAPADFKAGQVILFNERKNFIKLAELEIGIKLIATELEKTRRHVNSLEYVTIPNYRETIHYIKMRIEETSRSNTARLIKVKDMVLEEKTNNIR